jgi:hypothetical protein
MQAEAAEDGARFVERFMLYFILSTFLLLHL